MAGQNKERNYAMNKILIIDDDRELCALIKRSVQAENIEADFCNTGKEGLQKLREQEYQLVVLDVMIRIAPLDTQDIDLQINSSVEKQFGDAIRTTILDVLARYNVRGVQLNVDDKGALDCILRARLEALLARASGIPALPWEDCQ